MADKKPKHLTKDTGKKLITYDAETGEVISVKKKKDASPKCPSLTLVGTKKKHKEPSSMSKNESARFCRSLSRAIDSIHEDSNGCVNGEYVGDSTHRPDFVDLLTDERYQDPYDEGPSDDLWDMYDIDEDDIF